MGYIRPLARLKRGQLSPKHSISSKRGQRERESDKEFTKIQKDEQKIELQV